MDGFACTVVCAAPGYPGSYPKDLEIRGKDINFIDEIVFSFLYLCLEDLCYYFVYSLSLCLLILWIGIQDANQVDGVTVYHAGMIL